MAHRAEPAVLWVTRAQPGAEETATRLRGMGFLPLVVPVITTAVLECPPVVPQDFDAVALTSAAAVRIFAAMTADRSARIFAVGDATAHLATAAGWQDVTSASGDVHDLARLLAAAEGVRSVLHPCGEVVAGDLVGQLAARDRRVQPLPIYRTEAIPGPQEAVATPVQAGRLDGIILHSPSAARATAHWLAKLGGPADAILFALSSKCAEPLRTMPFREIVISPFPREAALLKVIAETFTQGRLRLSSSPERPVSP